MPRVVYRVYNHIYGTVGSFDGWLHRGIYIIYIYIYIIIYHKV